MFSCDRHGAVERGRISRDAQKTAEHDDEDEFGFHDSGCPDRGPREKRAEKRGAPCEAPRRQRTGLPAAHGGFDLLLDSFQVEGARSLAGRILLHGHEEIPSNPLHRCEDVDAVEEPVVVGVRVVLRFFERVATEIEEQRHAKLGEGLTPDFEGLATVFQEDSFPILVAHGDDLAVVIHVHEALARRLVGFAADVVELVGAIDVVLVTAAVEFDALFQLLHDVGIASGGGEGGQPVFMRDNAVADLASREVSGPLDETGHAVGTLPVRVLLAAEGRGSGIGPGVVVRAVVGGILDDGVVGDAEVIQQLEEFADLHVVLDHAVGVFIIALVAVFGLDVGAEMHAGAVPPAEERLAGLGLAGDEILGGGDGFLVDGFHAFLGQRAGVFDGLAALAVGLAAEHTAGAKDLFECFSAGQHHVAWVVLVLRFFLGVEVVEIAKELIEAVHGGQMFVAVALVVLAELAGGVAETLHDGGHGDVGFLPTFRAPGMPTLVMPVRTGTEPLMKAARPAVQLCWP